jgi:hypothetical protein
MNEDLVTPLAQRLEVVDGAVAPILVFVVDEHCRFSTALAHSTVVSVGQLLVVGW